MDVVTQYSPPLAKTSPINVTSQDVARGGMRRASLTSLAASIAGRSGETRSQGAHSEKRGSKIETRRSGKSGDKQTAAPSSTTFNRSVQITLQEPVGSMSISPANRDVVLAARKGLFIIDLDNLYDQPRFLAHLTTWVPADIQWNPHPFRANWVASTSNNKLLVWNLDRPEADRRTTITSGASTPSLQGTSPSLASLGLGITSPLGTGITLPQPAVTHVEALSSSNSQLSAISHVLNAHTRAITDINWSPFHPEVLASCGIDTWTWAWDLRDPSKPKQGYSAWNSAMTQVKWNRATPHRLATSCDNKVLIWDDRKGALPLATIEAHENHIYGVDWSRELSSGASRLVTCSLDGTVKWWDLDAPEAQQAIGQRKLITDPELVIKTSTPVWRARHLPFGQGVMTLPQRGDTALSMWSKEQTEEPVHRFSGHRDVVKEYLFRTQGGEDRTCDSRKFQLITWSKDQTLRLWPITEEMTKAVGHQTGVPITVRQTRVNAPNITYRNPPFKSGATPKSNLLTGHEGGHKTSASSAEVTPGTSLTGIAPPAEATRSLLSGSYKGAPSSSNSGSIQKTASPPAGLSPYNRVLGPGSFGRPESHGSRRGERGIHKTVSVTQLAVRESQRRKVSVGQTSMHGRVQDMPVALPASGSTRHSYGSRRSNTLDTADDSKTDKKRYDAKKRRADKHDGKVMSSRAASRNFMTRGTTTNAAGPLQSRAGAQKKTSYVDAVGWIAGVRINRETKPHMERKAILDSETQAVNLASSTQQIDNSKRSPEEVDHKDVSQLLSEEIMSITNKLSQASFEKVDVSARSCTASCYGPWGVKHTPCFIRIVFTVPLEYPAKQPRFELEHNASVPLKTRAYMLRTITSILKQKAGAEPPEMSMEACLFFLLGHTLEKRDAEMENATQLAEQPFWLPGVEEQEEEEEEEEEEKEKEDIITAIRTTPRPCGASFAANGMLVTFNACQPSTREGSTMAKIDLIDEPSGSTTHSIDGLQASAMAAGRSRFLQSYSALAGAMTSLARLAKEGMSVQDLDVVQLMSDEAFFNKRLQQPGHRHGGNRTGTSCGPTGSKGNGRTAKTKISSEGVALDTRIAALTLQDRLGLGDGRSISRSQSRRARSASPMSHSHSRQGHASDHASPMATSINATAGGLTNHSRVRIWNMSNLFGEAAPSQIRAPSLNRRRSASTPISPAILLTPRSEYPFASYLVPSSARPDNEEDVLPASIATSRRDQSDLTGYRIRQIDSDEELSTDDEELDAAGLLERVQRDNLHPAVDQTLDTVIWLIPFASIFLFFDIMIQQQYAMQPTFWSEIKHLSNAVPFLGIVVYITTVRAELINRYVLQAGLLGLGIVCGGAFLHTYTRSSQPIVVRQTPPLATLWIYSIARLELTLAVFSLMVVYGYVRYANLNLFG